MSNVILDFTSLDDFYLKIESYSGEIASEVSAALIRLNSNTVDRYLESKILIEQYVFDFIFRDGEIDYKMKMVGENGTTLIYPSFSNIDEDGYNYLQNRAKEVKNNYLVSRYNLVLWHSPLKQRKFDWVRKAIDANFELINPQNLPASNSDYWMWYQSINNSLLLSVKLRYKQEAFYDQLTNLISDCDELDYQYKFLFLDTLTVLPKYLSKYGSKVSSILANLIVSGTKENEMTILFQMYEAGLRIARKLNQDTNIWNERIGDYFVSAAELRMNDETRIIPLKFLSQAIPYFKQAKAADKVEATEKKYYLLKKELNLKGMPFPVDYESLKKISKLIEKQVNIVLKLSERDIYRYLANSLDVIPDVKKINENSQPGFLTQFFTPLRFDINRNISDTDEPRRAVDPYHFYILNTMFQFLHRLFIVGITNGKIKYSSFIEYILNDTWMGETFVHPNAGESRQYNWISIIAPAIHEYFIQLEFEIKSGQTASYILAIDSLTLKFEGALRHFCTMIGLSSTRLDKKNDILREKYIEDLLSEEELKEFFTDDEIYLFNHVFVSKTGFCLRHNVAHCFFKQGEYSIHYMHLLILCFLRLGKYNSKPFSADTTNATVGH